MYFQQHRGISPLVKDIFLCFHQHRGMYLHFQEIWRRSAGFWGLGPGDWDWDVKMARPRPPLGIIYHMVYQFVNIIRLGIGETPRGGSGGAGGFAGSAGSFDSTGFGTAGAGGAGG